MFRYERSQQLTILSVAHLLTRRIERSSILRRGRVHGELVQQHICVWQFRHDCNHNQVAG